MGELRSIATDWNLCQISQRKDSEFLDSVQHVWSSIEQALQNLPSDFKKSSEVNRDLIKEYQESSRGLSVDKKIDFMKRFARDFQVPDKEVPGTFPELPTTSGGGETVTRRRLTGTV